MSDKSERTVCAIQCIEHMSVLVYVRAPNLSCY